MCVSLIGHLQKRRLAGKERLQFAIKKEGYNTYNS